MTVFVRVYGVGDPLTDVGCLTGDSSNRQLLDADTVVSWTSRWDG